MNPAAPVTNAVARASRAMHAVWRTAARAAMHDTRTEPVRHPYRTGSKGNAHEMRQPGSTYIGRTPEIFRSAIVFQRRGTTSSKETMMIERVKCSRGIYAVLTGAVLCSGAVVPRLHAAGVIVACVGANGGMRAVAGADACKRSETALTWNAEGPAGTAGPAGPIGPAGPDGPAGRD